MATIKTQIGKPGMVPRGDFNIITTYAANDIVSYQRSAFLCISDDTVGIYPDDLINWRPLGMGGLSGVIPLIQENFASAIMIIANTMTNISELTDAITITLNSGEVGMDNEWGFIITQGATAQNVILPIVHWYGAMPTFAANSITQARLFYRGAELRGICL